MTEFFGNRLRAFEAEFSHNQEISFKIAVKATRLMALWAASFLGYEDGEEEAYVSLCLEKEISKLGFEALIDKIHHDFYVMGLEFERSELFRILDDKLALARAELYALH